LALDPFDGKKLVSRCRRPHSVAVPGHLRPLVPQEPVPWRGDGAQRAGDALGRDVTVPSVSGDLWEHSDVKVLGSVADVPPATRLPMSWRWLEHVDVAAGEGRDLLEVRVAAVGGGEDELLAAGSSTLDVQRRSDVRQSRWQSARVTLTCARDGERTGGVTLTRRTGTARRSGWGRDRDADRRRRGRDEDVQLGARTAQSRITAVDRGELGGPGGMARRGRWVCRCRSLVARRCREVIVHSAGRLSSEGPSGSRWRPSRCDRRCDLRERVTLKVIGAVDDRAGMQ